MARTMEECHTLGQHEKYPRKRCPACQAKKTERDYLRQVRMVPYVDGRAWTLRTWDTGREHGRGPQWCVGYELCGPDGRVIFTGEDYGCSPMDAIDSDACLRGLLGFLTLRPGDTDEEYFAGYTAEQMDFARTDAESLSLWAMEASDDPPVFEEIRFPHDTLPRWARAKAEKLAKK